MRRGQKPELIFMDEVFLGVNLSADYCAEHEWGIKGLKQDFGLNDDISVYGIAKRATTRVPENLAWVEFSSKYSYSSWDVKEGRAKKAGDVKLKNAGFALDMWFGDDPSVRIVGNRELYGVGLRAAWSEDDLAVVSSDVEQQKLLKVLFDEIKKSNAVVTWGASLPVFENPGIVLAIADRIPESVRNMWQTSDAEYHQLRKDFDATGIEKLLAKAGKRYYSLRPSREKDGSLKFWLNPQEQKSTISAGTLLNSCRRGQRTRVRFQ